VNYNWICGLGSWLLWLGANLDNIGRTPEVPALKNIDTISATSRDVSLRWGPMAIIEMTAFHKIKINQENCSFLKSI
jgi:hypothetical protein